MGNDAAPRAVHSPAKTSAPRLTGILERPRLYGLVDRARRAPIVWINGPAGCGKTVLAASYLQARGVRSVWYRCDARDQDPAAFFHYLRQALARLAPHGSDELPPLRAEYLSGLPAFTRNFFERAFESMKAPAALVLEDFHDLPDGAALLGMLPKGLALAPAGVSVIVLSRAAPPAQFAYVEANRALCRLPAGVLDLTLAEARALARRLGGPNWSGPTARRLHGYVNGWMAGWILLLARSREERLRPSELPKRARDRMFDYLAAEVLLREPPEVQQLLVRCAVLPHLGTAEASSLSGSAQAPRVLAALARRNYFVARQAGRGVRYHFHPLFREFLLERGHSPAPGKQVSAAADALIGGGELEQAAELLRASGDGEALGALVEAHAEALVAQGRLATLDSWLRALPVRSFELRPWLCYWRAACRVTHDLLEARELFERAFLQFRAGGDATGAYQAWSGIAESFIYAWDDYRGLDRWLDELEGLLRDAPIERLPTVHPRVACAALITLTFARGDSPQLPAWVARAEALLQGLHAGTASHMRVASALHYYYGWIGDTVKLRRMRDELEPYAADRGAEHVARLYGIASVTSSGWLIGDTQATRYWAARGLEYGTRNGVRMFDSLFHSQASFACQLDGDVEGAALHVARLERAVQPQRRLDLAHSRFHAAWTALERGQHARARAHAEASLQAAQLLTPGSPIALSRFKLAEVLIAFGEFSAAFEQVELLTHYAARMGSELLLFMAELLRARVLLRAGRHAECVGPLSAALARGRRQELTVYPNWHGRHVAELCAFALQNSIEREFATRLVRERGLSPPPEYSDLDIWPWRVRVVALGRFEVRVGGEILERTPGQHKPLELFKAALALGARELSEEHLGEMLWPEAEGDAALRNLKITVHRLRKLVPHDAVLRAKGKLALNPSHVWVDAWALERHLARLDAALHEADVTGATALCARIVDLYKGPFLEADAQSWAVAARERLRGHFVRSIGSAADVLGRRSPQSAVELYEKVLEADAVSERSYQGLIRCHRELQQPNEALRVYRRCREVLQRELNRPPSAATEALVKVL